MVMRRRTRDKRQLTRKLAKLVVALWLIGLLVFIVKLPGGEEPPPVSQNEGIVVPTGGAERIATGFRLLSEGGKRLLITGVHKDTTLAALEALTEQTAAPCCVDLDYTATDTLGNAAFAAAWAAQHGLTEVRLVTSWYHMPRSAELFRRAMPDVRIIPHPVSAADIPSEGWWQNPNAWRLIVGEYIKLLWAWVS